MPLRPAPPHVLMSADALGGVWPYTLDLAAGLIREGAAVTVALMGPAPAPERIAAAEAATGARILATGLPLDWTADTPEAVRAAAAALAWLACSEGADLVHLHAPALALARFPGPVVAVCHSCVATWWAAVESGPLPLDLAWRSDLAARGCAAADRLLAPTHAFAEATRAVYSLPEAPLVVRNGRDAVLTPFEGTPAARIFGAGRLWDRAKNAAALDRMAARLRLPVQAAGPVVGPHGARFAAANLRLLGCLDEAGMTAELADRPIFVSLALYEPFGLAVLEAASAACALVLSDIPTFRELWEGVALFVDPEDDAAAARAVESLALSPERRRALGTAARARAEGYGVGAMVEGVRAVHRALLASGHREVAA